MQKTLFLGDEALAQGALDAGLSGVYAYPGTPSTEITEYIQGSKQAAEGNAPMKRQQWKQLLACHIQASVLWYA